MNAATSHQQIHPGDIIDDAAAQAIVAGLRARTLPKPAWTHGAHLTAGATLLREAGLAAAIEAMPELIKAYNLSVGVMNSDTEGYHHTITLFYLRIIAHFLIDFSDATVGECATALLASPLADRAYPLGFYSKERLFSVTARRSWVAPDLKPLPAYPSRSRSASPSTSSTM